MAKIAAVIVAAGSGARAAGTGDVPKQFRPVGGEAVLRRCLSAFAGCGLVHIIQPVIRPGDVALYRESAEGLASRASRRSVMLRSSLNFLECSLQ